MAQPPKAPTDKDFGQLGKALSKVLVRDYINIADNWKRFIWLSFVRGIFVGLGGVIGATVVLAILIWLLSGFDDIPLVGNLFEAISETIEKRRQ